LVLEKGNRMMNILQDEGVKLDGTSISLLALAHDIMLLGNNMKAVKSLCKRHITAAEKEGLQINEEKTKYMEARRQQDGKQAEHFLKVRSYSFKKVSEFKYLGTMITQSNNMESNGVRIKVSNGQQALLRHGQLI